MEVQVWIQVIQHVLMPVVWNNIKKHCILETLTQALLDMIVHCAGSEGFK